MIANQPEIVAGPNATTPPRHVERDPLQDGFVLRYRAAKNKNDGLPGTEGAFLPCSFWLVNCLHLTGRTEEGRELFQGLVRLQNDLGSLSEEYDPAAKQQLGNFPPSFFPCGARQQREILARQADLIAS